MVCLWYDKDLYTILASISAISTAIYNYHLLAELIANSGSWASLLHRCVIALFAPSYICPSIPKLTSIQEVSGSASPTGLLIFQGMS